MNDTHVDSIRRDAVEKGRARVCKALFLGLLEEANDRIEEGQTFEEDRSEELAEQFDQAVLALADLLRPAPEDQTDTQTTPPRYTDVHHLRYAWNDMELTVMVPWPLESGLIPPPVIQFYGKDLIRTFLHQGPV